MAELEAYNVVAGSNDDPSPLGMPEGMDPSAVNNSWREHAARHKRWLLDNNGSLDSTGSSNTYALGPNTTSVPFDGMTLAFEANFASTGAATLNVTPSGGSAHGAKAIVWPDGTALASGAIPSGAKVWVVYDLANTQWMLQTVSVVGITSLAADTSPQLGGDLDLNGNNIDFPSTANIADCHDEDDMSSDDPVALATQQSIKAYVDGQDHLTQAAAVLWTDADSIATTTGTVRDIGNIVGVNEIHIGFSGVSTDAANTELMLQIGDSGGIETSGYDGAGVQLLSPVVRPNSAGFIMTDNVDFDAATTFSGLAKLIHLGSNIWAFSVQGSTNGATTAYYTGTGIKTLTGTLTTIRLTTVAGSANFDLGTMYSVAR